MSVNQDTQKHLEKLEDDNLQIREMARWSLVSAGSDVVPELIETLRNDRQRCRWEAARLLGKIRDKRALEPLVEALLDDSINVHWVASEALIQYGKDAILPLLKGLIRHFDSVRFRHGAYHILHMMERFSHLDPKTQAVLDALRGMTPSVSAPWAAERAIEAIMFENNLDQGSINEQTPK